MSDGLDLPSWGPKGLVKAAAADVGGMVEARSTCEGDSQIEVSKRVSDEARDYEVEIEKALAMTREFVAWGPFDKSSRQTKDSTA